ncbi:MAG: methionyl-tRNA formyltransferase [Candidatus Beckwithbacteria bacterium]|nr:methionyl-tRNA formyltransferase [Patescibacteria group bacterium]
MKPLNILFFGSAPESDIVFNKLKSHHHIYKGEALTGPRPFIDLIVVASYGHKISKKTLDIPKYGSLNIHPSLLPKYRGAAPVPWTILNKEKQTGVTIFKMDSGWDTGPIIARQKHRLTQTETTPQLLSTLFTIGVNLLIKTLPDYIEDNITPIKQPKKSPTPYAKKLTKQDGFIVWQEFIKQSKTNFTSIDHKIRAFYHWPGVWTKLPACAGRPNNKVLKLLPNNKFQLEGKQPITWQQLLNGYQHLLK